MKSLMVLFGFLICASSVHAESKSTGNQAQANARANSVEIRYGISLCRAMEGRSWNPFASHPETECDRYVLQNAFPINRAALALAICKADDSGKVAYCFQTAAKLIGDSSYAWLKHTDAETKFNNLNHMITDAARKCVDDAFCLKQVFSEAVEVYNQLFGPIQQQARAPKAPAPKAPAQAASSPTTGSSTSGSSPTGPANSSPQPYIPSEHRKNY